MIHESSIPCAYELCKKTDPIEIVPGHRRKLYHDENCRQAQHRLLEARAQLTTLRQLWSDYLPATQHLLEEILAKQGEATVQRVAAAIAAERKQARQPSLSEDERAALQHQWSDLQRGTQQILESLLNSGRGDPSTLFHLILLAIQEERRHAQCNSELDQRAASLDMTLSAYRAIIDLEDRAKLVQQFLAIGQLLNYRAIPKFRIDAGLQAWQDYQSWTYEDTLAEVIIYAREVVAQEIAARELADNRSKVRQMERDLNTAQAEIHELREQMQQAREASSSLQAIPTSALLAVQAYFHTHPGASLPLQRESQTFQLTAMRADGVAAATGYGLVTLSAEELHQLAMHTGTTILAPDSERQDMQARLCAIGERLHYCRLLVPNVQPDVECWQQFAEHASNEQVRQAIATAEHYYENLVYLDELEQRSRQAAQEKQQQKLRPRQVEPEFVEASATIQKLQRELSRYEPPPRDLLECTLRQWCKRTDLLYQDQPLAGEHLNAFLQEAGERKLVNYMKQGESGYFFGKHRRRRIALIQQHLATTEPYQGDPALRMERMDEQGYVSFGSGSRQYLDTDAINHIWARIMKEQGQQTVGGNADLAPIQRYLCEHPGQAIEIRHGKNLYQLVVVDDDALAITENVGPIRLAEDDIDQARCWIAAQS